MTRIASAAALVALMAAPAVAGDQPVIFPTLPPVYENGDPRIVYFYKFDTLGGTAVTTNLSGSVSGSNAPTVAATGASQGVMPGALPSGAAGNALYTALLNEAKSRGLR